MTGRVAWALALVASAASAGCLGPVALRHTRPRYNEAVRVTDRQEWLLNLVRLRYLQPPGFVSVSNIVAQFSADASGGFTGGLDRDMRTRLGTGSAGGSDEPTITYTPRDGPDFGRSLLQPAKLQDILFLADGGWSLDRLLRLTLHRMNGLPNASEGNTVVGETAPAYEAFARAAALAGELDRRGELDVTIDDQYHDASPPLPAPQVRGRDLVDAAREGYKFRSPDGGRSFVLTTRKRLFVMRPAPGAVAFAEAQELFALLRLRPGLPEYRVESLLEERLSAGPDTGPGPFDAVTVLPRSVLDMMFYLSKGVEVPPEHYAAGLVAVTRNPDGSPFDWGGVLDGLFRVRSCRHRPKDAETAVCYRDVWYYLDDADVSSKATLGLLVELSRLLTARDAGGAPVLTLPVGR